jgi:hypothetical protein
MSHSSISFFHSEYLQHSANWWVYLVNGINSWQCFAGLHRDIVLWRRTCLFFFSSNIWDFPLPHVTQMQLIAIICACICVSVTSLVIVFRVKYVCILYVSQRKCAEKSAGYCVKQQKNGMDLKLFYQKSWNLPVTVCNLFSVMFPFSNQRPSR